MPIITISAAAAASAVAHAKNASNVKERAHANTTLQRQYTQRLHNNALSVTNPNSYEVISFLYNKSREESVDIQSVSKRYPSTNVIRKNNICTYGFCVVIVYASGGDIEGCVEVQ